MTALRQNAGQSPTPTGAAGFQPAAHDQAARLRAMTNPPRSALRPTRASKVLTIASGKGGVGKTNIAVNTAVCLSQLGHRVALLDLDLGLANADLLCGLNPASRLDQTLLDDDSSLADIAVKAPGGFHLVPGSVGLARIAELSPDQRLELLSRLGELDTIADVLILDTGAGVGPLVRACLRAADAAAVVVTPEPTSIADAYALIKVMRQLQNRLNTSNVRGQSASSFAPSLIINEARDAHEAQDVHERMNAAAHRFLGLTMPLLGWVPLDMNVPLAVRDRTPFTLSVPRAPASKAVHALAASTAELLQLHVQAPPSPDGFFARLSRLLAGKVV